MLEFSKSLLKKRITDLTNITELNLDKLLHSITLIQILKGETILKKGQICKDIVFVEKGYLRAFVEKDGLEINTDFIFENNFTSNLKSLRLSIPSDITIQAGEDTLAYQFHKDKLLNLYKESSEIESFGRKLLEQLLISQEEHTNLFKIYSPAERYNYLQKHKPYIIQRVSLTQISSYLGVDRKTLSRIRKIK